MRRFVLTAGVFLFSIATLLLAEAPPPDSNQTFAEIAEKFIVQRNGEVVMDVRTSDPARWHQELERTAIWRMDRISPDVFRYIVIHEYNRYHSIQLGRDQKVLSFFTVHVEEKPLAASGPEWIKHTQK